MLRIVVEVDCPAGMEFGVKEQVAMDCEKYGDAKVVSVEEIPARQLEIRSLLENGYIRK